MDGQLEFLNATGILTIEGRTRTETREIDGKPCTVDIYTATNQRYAKFNRPIQPFEITYNRTAGRFITDISLIVSGKLSEESAREHGCRTYAELFEKQFNAAYYPQPRTYRMPAQPAATLAEARA